MAVEPEGTDGLEAVELGVRGLKAGEPGHRQGELGVPSKPQ